VFDFGSGYSNISNVLKLEVDGIKLDGGLIKQIIHDNDIYLFIEHIAAFANQLDLLLIAESVENAAIVNALQKANVTLMQGNHFAQPAPQFATPENADLVC
jgi:EAL domain-containing protein (putative c-di-GMP-specific phosphodiesterase class I)